MSLMNVLTVTLVMLILGAIIAVVLGTGAVEAETFRAPLGAILR